MVSRMGVSPGGDRSILQRFAAVLRVSSALFIPPQRNVQHCLFHREPGRSCHHVPPFTVVSFQLFYWDYFYPILKNILRLSPILSPKMGDASRVYLEASCLLFHLFREENVIAAYIFLILSWSGHSAFSWPQKYDFSLYLTKYSGILRSLGSSSYGQPASP